MRPLKLKISAFGPYSGVTEFDFGPSIKTRGRDVIEIIGDGMKTSAVLGLIAAGIALIIGVVLGLTGVNAHLPQNFFITQVIKAGNDCMSPVAMLITGITFGTMNFSEVFKKPGIYIASVIRLIIIPFVMFGIFSLIPVPEVVFKCIMIVSAMPLGLNSIVIPASYGKDTSAAAGMALVSHIISLATIPLFFMLVLA